MNKPAIQTELPEGAPAVEDLSSAPPESSAPVVTEEEESNDLSDEILDLFDEAETPPLDEVSPAPAAEAPPSPTEQTPPSEPEPPAAEASPPPMEEPAPEPVAAAESTPAEPAPAAAPEVTPVQEPEPGAVSEQQRTEALAALEKRYTLSTEDAERFVSEPEAILPKLASQLYIDVYEHAMRSVQQMLPQMVPDIVKAQQVREQDQSDFYTKWPALNDAKFSDLVTRIGRTYRELNPQADKDQFIQEVGLQSMIALRLPIKDVPNTNPPPPSPAPVPHTPARGGGVVTPPPAEPNLTPTDSFIQEIWEEGL